ncbi:MAG: glutamyl-tRNA reductase [Actinobacteria bacterium]|nr:glutamyl-tRNA reductase [Actinomycetota bacterium]
MPIIGAGLSHKTAPVEIREKLSISENKLPEALSHLLSKDSISEAVILSTCNRTEIYAVTEEVDQGKADIIDFLSEYHNFDRNAFVQALYFFSEEQVVRHLFRVASSLDSMVIGEAQILGQVKDAYNIAYENKATSLVLNRLFRHAVECGKRVRTETAIGEAPVSVSYAAVQLAKNVFETLVDRAVMVVGAGKMSVLTIKHLVSNGANPIMVTNRTYEKAQEIACEFNGIAVPFNERFEKMAQADIVISSTGAQNYVITADDVRNLMKKRKGRPIFFIDIAVPRDVDPEVAEIENVFVYDIDDLKNVVDENLKERKKEAEKAEKIVEEEVSEFLAWLASLDVVPTIKELNRIANEIKEYELEKALKRLNGLNEDQVEIIRALAHGIVNKMLHTPIVKVKEAAARKRGYRYVVALRYLFGLDESGKGDES